MFRALPCSSSGGKIVLLQNLVSSLSVNACTVRWLRADCRAVCPQPAYCTAVYNFTSWRWAWYARNMSRII